MSRRIDEMVMVRADEDGVPGTFLWRDRIYVVRGVHGHWHELRSWWTSSAARAVHGEAATEVAQVNGPNVSVLTMEGEREIWRVEASSGRAFGTGVYDLVRDAAAVERPDQREQRWRLLSVTD